MCNRGERDGGRSEMRKKNSLLFFRALGISWVLDGFGMLFVFHCQTFLTIFRGNNCWSNQWGITRSAYFGIERVSAKI